MTAVAHAERAHALLSASSSHRWLVCTPSVRLEETLPDTAGEAAKKGTLAHEIAELKLQKYFTPMGPRKFNAEMKKLKTNPIYEDEMDAATDVYLEYIQKLVHGFTTPPHVAIEKRLDYSAYAQEGFGTGDCTIVGSGVLSINDLKYGKGHPVSAVGNTQMRLYALGAVAAYRLFHDIRTIRMAIIQPRLNTISEDEISIEELLAWGESIKPIAAKAYAGEGDYIPGEHCKFCRAQATCRARVESIMSATAAAPLKPPLISWEEAAKVLEQFERLGVVNWYGKLKDQALTQLLQGGEVPGWKAVRGRSSRNYANIDAAFAHLMANGIDEALLYERKPLTAPAVEKILKTKQYRELLEEPGHIRVDPGKPTIAPADDKREAITDRIDPATVFGTVAEEA
ncbi:DUF2800 domain-containing protein [Cohnella nanjingensis]|uniref:DUF2800 domain-containing protein n=1 Tax=Cohnella nanjingensis TaxID=1387779 RepID=A0A7X0RMS0_9BACL|nr:DUF2800 domain-containing protein [Cohnella nanjingensis]MBB6670251.1 DUF2800 domain-containing protein [Cohnella nanjingensis]